MRKGSKIKITEETEEVIKVKIGDEGTGEDDKEAHKEGLESKEEGFGVDKKKFSEKKHEKEQLEEKLLSWWTKLMIIL